MSAPLTRSTRWSIRSVRVYQPVFRCKYDAVSKVPCSHDKSDGTGRTLGAARRTPTPTRASGGREGPMVTLHSRLNLTDRDRPADMQLRFQGNHLHDTFTLECQSSVGSARPPQPSNTGCVYAEADAPLTSGGRSQSAGGRGAAQESAIRLVLLRHRMLERRRGGL